MFELSEVVDVCFIHLTYSVVVIKARCQAVQFCSQSLCINLGFCTGKRRKAISALIERIREL